MAAEADKTALLTIITNQDQGTLHIAHRPSDNERAAYGGCASIVGTFAGVGALAVAGEAFQGATLAPLVEAVPGLLLCGLIVFVLVNKARSRGELHVSRAHAERRHETLLGVRARQTPLQEVSAVVLEGRRGHRNFNVRITVTSGGEPVELMFWQHPDEARALGAELSAFFGVPLSETGDWAGF